MRRDQLKPLVDSWVDSEPGVVIAVCSTREAVRAERPARVGNSQILPNRDGRYATDSRLASAFALDLLSGLDRDGH